MNEVSRGFTYTTSQIYSQTLGQVRPPLPATKFATYLSNASTLYAQAQPSAPHHVPVVVGPIVAGSGNEDGCMGVTGHVS